MTTKEEIKKQIREMMEKELKEFEGYRNAKKWWKSMGDPEYAQYMEANAKKHFHGYDLLSELLDYINEK